MSDAFDELDSLSKARLVNIVNLLLIEIGSAQQEDRRIAEQLTQRYPDSPETSYLLEQLQWKERHQGVLHGFAELVALGGYCGDDVPTLRAERALRRSLGRQRRI